jgi:hypothetical protein
VLLLRLAGKAQFAKVRRFAAGLLIGFACFDVCVLMCQ